MKSLCTFVFNKLRDAKYLRFSLDSPSYNSYKFWTCVYPVLRAPNKLAYIIFHLRFGLPNFLFLAIFISHQTFCVVCRVSSTASLKELRIDKSGEAAVFVKAIHAGFLGHSQFLSRGSVGVK